MMRQMTPVNNTSHATIENMEDLTANIALVKARIRIREKDLKERLDRLPEETVKSAISSVIPAFVSNLLPGKGIGLITSVAGLLLGKDTIQNGNWIGAAGNIAKQIGLFTTLKSIYSLWRKKKPAAKE
ncbi:hypothetical protein [Limnovirga soli]|uniref:Uncharacterized protein n=1 Tax=Limnovirga soli TaxID=2656915 RepID=A0A8J8JUJ8_9BACT|nr:hypothetical protein [Limnovirga soli]NNV57108.1 hypothetical protein [Limnovirga soli]